MKNKTFSTILSPEVHNQKAIHVVGIGASAGGLDAIEQFFANMPSSNGMAFIVIQHLSSKYKSFMPELLAKKTNMDIVQIEDGMTLQENTVYLAAPHYFVTLKGSVLELTPYDQNEQVKFPIDKLFSSLALSHKTNCTAVILSGKGNDGTEGAKLIRAEGGTVLVQDETTAKYPDMPHSAVQAHLADYILSPSAMPELIQNNLLNYDFQYNEETLQYIFTLIKKKTGIDFSLYKKNSVLRRIEKRMSLLDTPCETLEVYRDYLNAHPVEIVDLQRDLLIGVTQFLRDKEAFSLIEEQVIPKIVNRKIERKEDEIRIWVAGCSTGQEAYSLAILFHKYLLTVNHYFDVRIFATDIDKQAIKVASQGIYTEDNLSVFSEEQISQYFEPTKHNSYQVKKSIRKMIVFAPHNIAKDSPFVNVDLISCRNMLIYFQAELQQRILSLFHFSLTDEGTLFLGPSETTGKLSNLFQPISNKWKVFKSTGQPNRQLASSFKLSKSISNDSTMTHAPIPNQLYKPLPSLQLDSMYQALINNFMSPCLVLNEYNEVIFCSKDATKLINVPAGKIHYTIFKMVPVHVSLAIGAAIKRVKEQGISVCCQDIDFIIDGSTRRFNLTVSSFPTNDSLHLLVFDEQEVIGTSAIEETLYLNQTSTINELLIDLEQELHYTQQHLQTTIEELETTNEELKSTNEELIASNEELQSTNEELQSVNEELISVNNQYERKIDELTDLNNDIDNLLISTTIATIFLDDQLHIKLFTPETKKVINVLHQDVGRPFFHISHNLRYNNLVDDARYVLQSNETIHKEIQSDNGQWYSMKMMPYRTTENLINGVVITFIDITEIKRSNEELAITSFAVAHSPTSIFITDHQGQIKYMNQKFTEYKVDFKKMFGMHVYDFYTKQLGVKNFPSIWNEVYRGKKWNGEISYTNDDSEAVWQRLLLMPIKNEANEVLHYIGLSEDISQHKQSEIMLKNSEMLSALGQLAAGIAHEIRNPLTSLKGFLQLMLQEEKYKKEYIDVMMSEFNRLELIISELLILAKPEVVKYEHKNISTILMDVCTLLHTQAIMKNITITSNIADDLPTMYCIEKDMKQVFINMVKNAIEAMDNPGSIYVNANYDLTDQRIVVHVIDEGKGMPKERLKRISEPFFTTKEKGTGLGLMVSHKIISNHKGTIFYDSEENKGTTVEIRLPLS
ncbi:CheR family methyltransferase [Priestia flexa]|uniref:CheR family methyltransferase n=1 Tax=Priestia flexa TaxID=86664 RepID=UPI003D2EA151